MIMIARSVRADDEEDDDVVDDDDGKTSHHYTCQVYEMATAFGYANKHTHRHHGSWNGILNVSLN